MRLRRVLGWFILMGALPLMVFSHQVLAQNNAYRVVGFYLSYDIYDTEYFVTDIPADKLTHLNYGYVKISDNGQCESSDTWADTGFKYPGDGNNERLRGNFKQLKLLKEDHPDLKILMSIGGWEFSEGFSQAARTQDSRIRLVRSCVAFMREFGFDGIDLDWQYPVVGGAEDTPGIPEDSQNLTLLTAEFRGQLDYWSEREGEVYLLTLTAPAFERVYSRLELDAMQGYLDWFNLTTYGFDGSWSDMTSHHAPLYSNSHDPREAAMSQGYTVDSVVNAYLDAGVPASKLVVGIPFYAQAWADVRDNDFFGLYQATGGVTLGTRPGGTLYYGDMAPLLNSDSYIHYFDDEAKAPWLYNPTERVAISYENPQSIQYKTAYIRAKGLGGAMIWELSFDDEKQPLLDTVYEGLFSNVSE